VRGDCAGVAQWLDAGAGIHAPRVPGGRLVGEGVSQAYQIGCAPRDSALVPDIVSLCRSRGLAVSLLVLLSSMLGCPIGIRWEEVRSGMLRRKDSVGGKHASRAPDEGSRLAAATAWLAFAASVIGLLTALLALHVF
jgi:hypothetical protein